MKDEIVTFRLDKNEMKRLTTVSEKRETSKSELLRRALRHEFQRAMKEEKEEKRTAGQL